MRIDNSDRIEDKMRVTVQAPCQIRHLRHRIPASCRDDGRGRNDYRCDYYSGLAEITQPVWPSPICQTNHHGDLCMNCERRPSPLYLLALLIGGTTLADEPQAPSLEAGMTDYTSKPIQPQTLMDAIENCVPPLR